MKIFSVLFVLFLVPAAKASSVQCTLVAEDNSPVQLAAAPSHKGELSGQSGIYEGTVVFTQRKDVKLIEMQIVDVSTGKLATSRSSHKGKNQSVSVTASLEDSSGAKFAELTCNIK